MDRQTGTPLQLQAAEAFGAQYFLLIHCRFFQYTAFKDGKEEKSPPLRKKAPPPETGRRRKACVRSTYLWDGKEDSYERLRPQARFGAQPPQSGGTWRGDNPGRVSFVFDQPFFRTF